ncbi:hypothetical protein D3C72_2071320 [compost metagenome]
MATDGINGASPALLSDWRARFGQGAAVDDLRRAEAAQVVGLLRTPCRGDHAIAQVCQQRDRDGSGAAIGAGHEDVTARGCQAAVFQRQH